MNIAIVCNSPLNQEVLNQWTYRIPGTSIIGSYANGEEFSNQKIAPQTDILIMDFDAEENSDLNLLKRMSRKYRKMGILIVSMYNDPNFQQTLRGCGVNGCIEKYFINSDLEPAIHKINEGGAFFNNLVGQCA